MNEELVSKLVGDVGWLAPDGKYYPCEEYDPTDTGTFFHLHTAIHITDVLYPGVCDGTLYGENDPQSLLTREGWIRIDVEELFFTRRPTKKQIDTLFDLYHLKGRHYLPKDKIRQVLAWCGMKFLSNPGDDYAALEINMPDADMSKYPRPTLDLD